MPLSHPTAANEPTKVEHLDLLVLGSGEAGKYLAWTLSSTQNLKAAVIERQYYGGSCPNIACLPSKNMVYSAKVAKETKQASQYGAKLAKSEAFEIDMRTVRQRKREMVSGLVDMHVGKFKATGVEMVWGDGKFVAEKTIEVTADDGSKRVFTAPTVVVCTGSRAKIDSSIPGLIEAKPLTHVEILELNVVPQHLIILGGGYIGLEFAQIMARFGSKVTVIERADRILKNEDPDVSEALATALTADGIEFMSSATVSGIEGTSGSSVTVHGTKSGTPFSLTGSHLLVATGRSPNTDTIGLEENGIVLTSSGHVSIDAQLRSTSCPGVFAVGDCAGSPHFTHVAFDDFRIVRDQLNGSATSKSTTGRQIPYVLFTDPELAHVGLSEMAAQKQGIHYRKAQLPIAAFLRTRTMSSEDSKYGFAKALVDDGDKIIGFTAIGPGAGELLPVVQLAMSAGLPYTSIADMVVTHPTLSEGLVYLFMAVPKKAEIANGEK